jgi:REP element-mobilizing transposase RayT
MPRRKIPLEAGKYYHIYNRGHNRSAIFPRMDDYGLFLRKYRQFVCPEHIETLAYVLMPNHYHILGRVRTDHASSGMQKFGISYSKVINAEMDRVGAIFQGSFQAKSVDTDEYMLQISKYIHLNPVRANLVRSPEDWEYSSYREYIGLRHGTLPITSTIHSILDSSCRTEQERHRRYITFMAEQTEQNFDFDEDFRSGHR